MIDLRYPRDKNFALNRRFLGRIADRGGGATTIFNLLEICGILSFNLNEAQLRELFAYFPAKYQVDVLPACDPDRTLPHLVTHEVLQEIYRKASFGDALLMAAIRKYVPGAKRFVSWDAPHFRGRMTVPVLTPKEFLNQPDR